MVGKIIYSQIKALTPVPVLWSWGASKFQAFTNNQIKGLDNNMGGLLFFVRGAKHKGHVIVHLNLNDTYTVSIGHVRKGQVKPIKQAGGVYFEDLPEIIDNMIEKQDHYNF